MTDLNIDHIEKVVKVCRRSATLEDQCPAADVDTVVRLSRYFVLPGFDGIGRTLSGTVP